jgi:hypothetical protein
MSKPRVIKAFEKLDTEIQEQIKLAYPRGFEKHLIRFKNIENKFVSALPFETEDKYYMVKMSVEEAQRIILDDDDYNDNGILRSEVREQYEEKFSDDDDLGDDDSDLFDDLDLDEIPDEGIEAGDDDDF